MANLQHRQTHDEEETYLMFYWTVLPTFIIKKIFLGLNSSFVTDMRLMILQRLAKVGNTEGSYSWSEFLKLEDVMVVVVVVHIIYHLKLYSGWHTTHHCLRSNWYEENRMTIAKIS